MERKRTHRPSENSVRTSFKYVLRMLSTEKRNRCSYFSTHSRMFANRRRVCSLWDFFSVLVSWTTLARFERGILALSVVGCGKNVGTDWLERQESAGYIQGWRK